MAIQTYNNLLYYKSEAGSPSTPYWQNIPLISGASFYEEWKERTLAADPTADVSWNTFISLNKIYPGASRVLVSTADSTLTVYTPIQNGASPTEPPASTATFSGWDAQVFHPSAVTLKYRGESTADADTSLYNVLMSSTSNMADESTIDITSGAASFAYSPAGELYLGNRSTVSSQEIYGNNAVGPKIVIGTFTGTGCQSTAPLPNATTPYAGLTYKDVYCAQRDNIAVHYGKTMSNLYLGGGDDETCALGETYLVAGAASFTGELINMKTGEVTTGRHNSLKVMRKSGTEKHWGGDWQTFDIVDSGHIEYGTIALPYTETVSTGPQPVQILHLKNNYTMEPFYVWSVKDWWWGPKNSDEVNANQDWRDYLDISVRYDLQTNTIRCAMYVKKRYYKANLAMKPRVNFMIMTPNWE